MKKRLCSSWGILRIVFCLVFGLLLCPAFASTTALAADITTDGVTKTYITTDEARGILQGWVDSHPFQLGAHPDPESDNHIVDGVEYYRFYLSIIRCCVAEILVHKETGALFHLSPLGDNTFEPVDDWYNREHAAYAGAETSGLPEGRYWMGTEVTSIPGNSWVVYNFSGEVDYYNDYQRDAASVACVPY